MAMSKEEVLASAFAKIGISEETSLTILTYLHGKEKQLNLMLAWTISKMDNGKVEDREALNYMAFLLTGKTINN